jgi:hypothetical protein
MRARFISPHLHEDEEEKEDGDEIHSPNLNQKGGEKKDRIGSVVGKVEFCAQFLAVAL